jgi:serine/threonine protein phosphatase PrpC
MDKVTNYLKTLIESKGLEIQAKHAALLSKISASDEIKSAVDSITLIQDKMINFWKKNLKIEDFINAHFVFPNATVGKPYAVFLDPAKEPLSAVDILDISSTTATFDFNKETHTLSATFTEPGEVVFELKFKLKDDSDEASGGIKKIKLLINPDPKSLWQNRESDKTDPYWKEDNVSSSAVFGNKKLIVASKRGRSHAHEGIFRDDDYGYQFFDETGWGIIAVADGAGSAKYSRQGSLLACQAVVDYFKNIPQDELNELNTAIQAEIESTNETHQKHISSFCIKNMGKAAFSALSSIKAEATLKGAQVKDYSTTLIFAFIKEFHDKLFVSSFWVGDGGIGIYSKEPNYVNLLGVPDSGEFSGQTRFLTMSEIFADNAYISRIKYKITDKSVRLVLMTDGITDAKFQTDAALEKIEIWNELMNDLAGANEENKKVELGEDIKKSEEELMKWMDFWSAGNHDDRTLAILY